MDGGGEVTGEKTRIYVGGLGAGVTEDDLRRTFSALGEVVSVDIVRTKGRSIAYLDFLPASDKSLQKLFSTYNGCMWKGGRLRLEKAKEHYLVKLKREWQEESERASEASDGCKTVATENDNTLQNPKKPSPADKTQIHIYFPKLRKVKSLAQVGIGKHKYSFQRIQVPPLPTHFCDCEEHSFAFPVPVKNRSSETESESYGVNEQELSIMNAVMKKIFERANSSKQVVEVSESTKGKDEEDVEDDLTDEDNLVINVANKKTDGMDLLDEMRAMMVNQGPVAKKLNTSEKPNKDRQKKKRKPSHSDEASRNFKTRLDTRENHKKEVELVTDQSGNDSLRSLKSTWKDLIGQKRDTSFSISDFIASLPHRKEEDLVSDKRRKLEGDQNESGPGPITEVDEFTTANSINDCQLEEGEPEADDLDFCLDVKSQQFRISDADHKEDERKSDDLVCNFENHEDDEELKKPAEDDDFDCNFENNEDDEELKKPSKDDDLDCNFENREDDEHDEDSKKPADDSHVKNDKDLTRTARGEFWRHKSSWTQLVSTATHSSFSISDIVPDSSFVKHEQQVDTFDSQPSNTKLDDQITVVKEVTTSPVKKNIPEKKRILSLGNLESDETCGFMRTEDSMKEWKKLKTSVSGSVNKKKRLVNESA